jgi:hypothetical protein
MSLVILVIAFGLLAALVWLVLEVRNSKYLPERWFKNVCLLCIFASVYAFGLLRTRYTEHRLLLEFRTSLIIVANLIEEGRGPEVLPTLQQYEKSNAKMEAHNKLQEDLSKLDRR